MRGRFDAGGTQEGIEQVTEGVAAAPQPRVPLLAQGSQRFPFGYSHNQKDELASLFLSTLASTTLGCYLKCKLSVTDAHAQNRTTAGGSDMDKQPGFVVEGERVALGTRRTGLAPTYPRW